MMQNKLVPWEYYTRRRGITLAALLNSRNIENYNKLQYWLQKEGIQCPEESEYDKAVASMKVVKPLKAVKSPAVKPAKAVANTEDKKAVEPKKSTRKRRVAPKKTTEK